MQVALSPFSCSAKCVPVSLQLAEMGKGSDGGSARMVLARQGSLSCMYGFCDSRSMMPPLPPLLLQTCSVSSCPTSASRPCTSWDTLSSAWAPASSDSSPTSSPHSSCAACLASCPARSTPSLSTLLPSTSVKKRYAEYESNPQSIN